jgi:hypothetical protein
VSGPNCAQKDALPTVRRKSDEEPCTHAIGYRPRARLPDRSNWSPEQALAVFELLSDLRARIWMQYSIELHDLIREQRSPPDDPEDILDDLF